MNDFLRNSLRSKLSVYFLFLIKHSLIKIAILMLVFLQFFFIDVFTPTNKVTEFTDWDFKYLCNFLITKKPLIGSFYQTYFIFETLNVLLIVDQQF